MRWLQQSVAEASCKHGRGLLRVLKWSPPAPRISASGASNMSPTDGRLTHKRSSARWVRTGGRRESSRCTYWPPEPLTALKRRTPGATESFSLVIKYLHPAPNPPPTAGVAISWFKTQETVHLGCKSSFYSSLPSISHPLVWGWSV